ncbi:MAG: hypothetical protein H0X66_10200 [Verrucomicrobia bacterium]|nr:hypothetical protein [Verrucomicrobiota bacterium]
MKTLTPTKAKQNLGALLARAAKGEDIGILHLPSGKIIALRPVEVYSEDYAFTEYGATPNEMKRVEKNLLSQVRKERKEGKLKTWKA